ncbi:hypothetical protein LR48_Vigan107s001800 [Vigna angularis]|uniref:Uncharacterized protein n=1 Tax=Phaseolus angularis TaxID=3914 RepID=A0A0L9T5W1_PHAAN|nr:hypothetical protein LR48_Vigan107s001800 [Vigna angularis]
MRFLSTALPTAKVCDERRLSSVRLSIVRRRTRTKYPTQAHACMTGNKADARRVLTWTDEHWHKREGGGRGYGGEKNGRGGGRQKEGGVILKGGVEFEFEFEMRQNFSQLFKNPKYSH